MRGVRVQVRVRWMVQVLVLGLAAALTPSTAAGQGEAGEADEASDGAWGSITGLVAESETGVRLAGVLVIVEGAGRAERTDSSGRFAIERVPPGTYTLRARFFGYRDAALRVRVRAGQQTDQLVIVAPDPLELEGITVTGEARGGLVGVVVDETSRRPIPNTLVRLEPRGAAVTDSIGVFALQPFPEDGGLLLVQQFGYEPLYVPVPNDPATVLEIALRPAPTDIEGLTVEVMQQNVAEMTRRITNRRSAAAVPVLSWNQERLARARSPDMQEFFDFETPVFFVPCARDSPAATCVIGRRGARVPMKLCIDDLPSLGGMVHLGRFRPEELYLVEVYERGARVLVYTRKFMERLAQRRQALMPLEYLGC